MKRAWLKAFASHVVGQHERPVWHVASVERQGFGAGPTYGVRVAEGFGTEEEAIVFIAAFPEDDSK